MEVTKDALMAAVDYNPATGVFTRKTTSKWNQRCNGQPIKTTDSYGYVVFKVGRKMVKAHRMAWLWVHGFMPPEQIDHINGNPADNRIANLRLASVKQNNENRRAGRNSATGIKGVTFKRYGKWRATIYHNKADIYLGEYYTIEEAIAARSAAERALFTHANLPPALS